MKLLDDNGRWIFLNPRPENGGKRAEYLSALKNIQIDLQAAAPDLAHLEFINDETQKKRVIARLALIKQQIELIENHL